MGFLRAGNLARPALDTCGLVPWFQPPGKIFLQLPETGSPGTG
jgi:hypothetical protein